MTLAQEITDYIVDRVARSDPHGFYRRPLVGFSSADDPLYERVVEIVGPPNLPARDILPEVKTLVSYFIPFTPKVVEANRVAPVEPAREWADSYAAANNLLAELGEGLKNLVELKGYKGAYIPKTYHYDQNILKAIWSHRSAALIAGLGRFGRHGLLITKAGGAGRYGTAFISAEVPPTPRSEEEYCLALKGGDCTYCFDHCPVKALGPESGQFDRHKCGRRLRTLTPYTKSLGWEEDVCGKCDVGPCAILEM